MKNFTLSILAVLLLTASGFTQNSNAVFFSESGDRFYVILNGLRQNDSPETNVKVTGLNPVAYQVKFIFEDETKGSFDKKIFLYDYTETTYKIKRKTESDASKSTKKFANKVAKNFQEKEEKDTVFTDKSDWWALRLVSEVPMPRPANTAAAQAQPRPSQRVDANAYSSQSATTTTTTTTTTGTAVAPATDQVSVNVNVGANGASGAVGINTNATYVEETTVTTTTTNAPTTAATSTQDHYVMPGYDGRIGCNWPMSDGDFASAKQSIGSKTFEDSKLTIAKQVISSNCLFAHQVREVMAMFDFEDTKLDFAKYAYGYTYDLNNYFKVNDAFEFESTIDELNAYIGTR